MSTKLRSILAKEGPIHDVAWSPTGLEYCVIYGFMPSITTVFNIKNEILFDFGAGSRNAIFYNPFGNVLLLCGFGNIRGCIEIWDTEKNKMIGMYYTFLFK